MPSDWRTLLFHLLSKLYKHTSVIITTNLTFGEWTSVFGAAQMKALLDRLTHPCHIVETCGESYRFRHAVQQPRRGSRFESKASGGKSSRWRNRSDETDWEGGSLQQPSRHIQEAETGKTELHSFVAATQNGA